MYLIEGAVLSNAVTVSVGDAVMIDTGAPQFVTPSASNTGIILGIVVAIKNGMSAGSVYLQEDTITTASDNQTNAQVNVTILPSDAVTTYVADLDEPAGTTTNSQFFGYFNLVSTDAGVLDESSYDESNEEQFLSYGVNPGNQSQVLGVWTKIAKA